MNTLTTAMKNFWDDEEGLQTLELMLIIAVIVVIALLFREQIIGWVKGLLEFGNTNIEQFKSN